MKNILLEDTQDNKKVIEAVTELLTTLPLEIPPPIFIDTDNICVQEVSIDKQGIKGFKFKKGSSTYTFTVRNNRLQLVKKVTTNCS